MNHMNISGTITEDPQSNEHDGILAASIRLKFYLESTVTVLAVGAVAQELCNFHNGEGILVSGKLIGTNGKLEILAERVAPDKGYRRVPPTYNTAGSSGGSRREALPMRVGKKAKRHW
jgi:hypothetical protein